MYICVCVSGGVHKGLRSLRPSEAGGSELMSVSPGYMLLTTELSVQFCF